MSEKRELKETLLFEKNHRIHGGIYHKMQVDFAYNSNHIEGSRLTHEQTCYIFETQSVDGAVFVNDVFETANHFRCLDWVLDTISEPLSEEYVKQMHRILKAGLMTQQNPEVVIGDYKKYANVVGGIETAKPGEVSAQMAQLLQTYQNLQQPDFYEIAWCRPQPAALSAAAGIWIACLFAPVLSAPPARSRRPGKIPDGQVRRSSPATSTCMPCRRYAVHSGKDSVPLVFHRPCQSSLSFL